MTNPLLERYEYLIFEKFKHDAYLRLSLTDKEKTEYTSIESQIESVLENNEHLVNIIKRVEELAFDWDGKESQYYGNKIMKAIHSNWGKKNEPQLTKDVQNVSETIS